MNKPLPPPLRKNVSGWPWDAPEQPAPAGDYPRISIVVPLYNHGSYIEETLRSILAQGYPNLELLVFDGGSTDASVDILKYYDPWIAYWESKKDKGQSDAINKGFDRSTGELITFQQSDDIYLPGAFLSAAEMHRTHPEAGVLAGGFYFMDSGSQRLGDDIPPFLRVTPPADLTLGPPNVYRMHQVALFYSKTALDTVGRYVRDDLNYTMDRELLYRVVRQFPAVLSDEPFGAFRKHAESKSTHSIRPFADEWARLHLEFKNGVLSQDRKRENMARFRLYRGEIQYAKSAENRREQIHALLSALRYRSSAVFSGAYLRLLLKVLLNKVSQV